MDCVFSLQFIWLNGWELRGQVKQVACNAAVAFVTQFSLMASLGWYVVMAVNFYFSATNPFVRPASRIMTYHVVTWTTATITAFIAASHSGYREDYRLCWLEKNPNGANVYNWLLYWAWIIAAIVVSVVIGLYGLRRWRSKTDFQDIQKTLETRRDLLTQTQVYIGVFTAYWLIGGSIWIVVQNRGMFR